MIWVWVPAGSTPAVLQHIKAFSGSYNRSLIETVAQTKSIS